MQNYNTETMQGQFGKAHRLFKIPSYTVKDKNFNNINDDYSIVKGSAGLGEGQPALG
jgi:hypothetical protein